jgi:hypothetical protein
MSRKGKKKKWRSVPWAGSSSSSALPSPSLGSQCRVARSPAVGPLPSCLSLAQGYSIPAQAPKRSLDWRPSWIGWNQGVTPLPSRLLPLTRESSRSLSSPPVNPSPSLGFPPDFVGAYSFPHCAAFLSHLWSLPSSVRSSFGGGWCVSPFRPPVVEEEWPLLGSGGFRSPSKISTMDPKGKNPQNSQWDRWGPMEKPQGSHSWNRPRNLSWKLKPNVGKSEQQEGVLSPNPGEGSQPGNPAVSPVPLKKDLDLVRPAFCQKCGAGGHHARQCFNALWCDICRKETHVTARCVLPRQNKPTMPIVGLAADGLGFYLSHFAKPLIKKPKRVFIGLVKVIEGLVSAEYLERDFSFHFPWNKRWKATKCHSGFLMQFPSQERLEEMISFPELKMKMSGAKIAVVPWSSRAKPKSRLHTVWVIAENVPEELQNYQSICEIGSMIGAVEEVDLMSLDSDDIVRFKIHIKSVAMIPPVVEVAVKPFLYDIFFRIESICDEGWNDDSVNLGKRASVQIHGSNDPLFDKSGKKPKNLDDVNLEDDPNHNLKIGESSSQGKEFAKMSDPTLVSAKDLSDEEQKLENLSDEKVDFDPNEDDLLSSQELEEFAKDMEEDQTDFQSRIDAMISIPPNVEIARDGKNKKNLDLPANMADGVRKSSRLEKNDDVKVADKAIYRAEAKDAFLNKGMCSNSFSLLDSNNDDLIDLANKLGVSLGPSDSDMIDNLELIKDLERSRKILAFQACKENISSSVEVPFIVDHKSVDSSIHNESDLNIDQDFYDVMVLRKGRKIKHRKKPIKKKASPKSRGSSTKKREPDCSVLPPDPF